MIEDFEQNRDDLLEAIDKDNSAQFTDVLDNLHEDFKNANFDISALFPDSISEALIELIKLGRSGFVKKILDYELFRDYELNQEVPIVENLEASRANVDAKLEEDEINALQAGFNKDPVTKYDEIVISNVEPDAIEDRFQLGENLLYLYLFNGDCLYLNIAIANADPDTVKVILDAIAKIDGYEKNQRVYVTALDTLFYALRNNDDDFLSVQFNNCLKLIFNRIIDINKLSPDVKTFDEIGKLKNILRQDQAQLQNQISLKLLESFHNKLANIVGVNPRPQAEGETPRKKTRM